jgi:hypothetical protein
MLSQIGGAIGSMGGAGAGLMRPIMTSFRPQLDPTNVESLQRQAAFQGRIGDTEQQRLFTNQALVLEEKQKEEAEKQRKLREGQAQAKAINAYTNALASEDETAIEAAQAEAMSVGYAQGIDMTPVLSQAENRFYNKKNQAYQEGERARVNKKRAEDAAVEKATQAMAAAFNKARTEEQLNGLLQSAGPLVAEQASILYRNNVARLEADRARAEREAEAGAPIELLDPNLIPSGDAIPDETSANLKKRMEIYNAAAKDANDTVAGKGFLPQTTRNNLRSMRSEITSRLNSAIDSVALYDWKLGKAQEEADRKAIIDIKNDSFNEDERTAAKKRPWFESDLTELQAIRLLRNQAFINLLGAERAAEHVQYEKGDPESVLAGLPKPGEKAKGPAPEDFTFEDEAPAPAAAQGPGFAETRGTNTVPAVSPTLISALEAQLVGIENELKSLGPYSSVGAVPAGSEEKYARIDQLESLRTNVQRRLRLANRLAGMKPGTELPPARKPGSYRVSESLSAQRDADLRALADMESRL